MYEFFNNVSKSPSEKYEKYYVKFTITFFGSIKHLKLGSDSAMCRHINCKTKHKKTCTKIITQKYYNKNGWKALENKETHTESKEPKSLTQKYGEAGHAA